MGQGRKIQLSFNVLNLFNQATATNYFQTENISGDALSFDEADFYAHKLNFQTLKAQQKLGTDPRFLMNNGYQTPIQARIGFKFLF